MPPLLIAVLVVLLEGLSLSALFPVIHAYCQELGGAAFWTGLVFALVAAPKVVMNPVWGRLSDRWGRRRVLMLITLGTASSSVGWALAPSLIWLAVARTIGGIFGAQAAVSSAVAADVSTPQRRAASMAMLGIAFGVAFTFGPAAGGFVGETWSYRSVGWLCASFQTLSLLLITFGLRETHPDHVQTEAVTAIASRSFAQLARIPNVIPLLGISTLMTLSISELFSSLGMFTESAYNFTAHDVGYGLSMLGLLGAIVQGGVRRMVARFGEKRLAAAGLFLLAAGMLILGTAPTESLFWVALGLAAIGSALGTTCLTALLSHCVSGRDQGAALGMNQSTIGLGRTIGFVMGGALFGALGAAGPYFTAAAFALAGFVWLVAMRSAETADTPVAEVDSTPAGPDAIC